MNVFVQTKFRQVAHLMQPNWAWPGMQKSLKDWPLCCMAVKRSNETCQKKRKKKKKKRQSMWNVVWLSCL